MITTVRHLVEVTELDGTPSPAQPEVLKDRPEASEE